MRCARNPQQVNARTSCQVATCTKRQVMQLPCQQFQHWFSQAWVQPNGECRATLMWCGTSYVSSSSTSAGTPRTSHWPQTRGASACPRRTHWGTEPEGSRSQGTPGDARISEPFRHCSSDMTAATAGGWVWATLMACGAAQGACMHCTIASYMYRPVGL